MSLDPSAITVSNVCFFYPGQEVLHDVSFTVGAQELVAVVGPNGGGKTTLLKLLLGALQPACGSISVLGASPSEARRRVGYVPQTVNVDPRFPLNVFEAVLMGRCGRIRFRYGSRDLELARRALGRVGMDGRLKQPFASLSGGERQRVLIAQALAGEPELLLLDEPVANVDPEHTARLYDLFKELSSTMPVLMVSHNLAVVTEHATHVLCVNRTVGMHRLGEVASETFKTSFGSSLASLTHHHCSVGGWCQSGGCCHVN